MGAEVVFIKVADLGLLEFMKRLPKCPVKNPYLWESSVGVGQVGSDMTINGLKEFGMFGEPPYGGLETLDRAAVSTAWGSILTAGLTPLAIAGGKAVFVGVFGATAGAAVLPAAVAVIAVVAVADYLVGDQIYDYYSNIIRPKAFEFLQNYKQVNYDPHTLCPIPPPGRPPWNGAKTAADPPPTCDPLVLDLNGDGITTISVKDGPWFDHDYSGFVEQTGWVDPDDGFLVMDRNGNGTIDDGRELFGDQTILKNGRRATNGFQALADLDSTHNGKIDASDTAFSRLRIWRDVDGDGYSSPDELHTLDELGITSIGLASTWSGVTDPQGNIQNRIGSFEWADGTTGQIVEYALERETVHTIPTQWLDVPDDIFALPFLEGYGNVYDLQQAMVRDESGELRSLVEQFMAETDATARNALMEQILFKWTGSKVPGTPYLSLTCVWRAFQAGYELPYPSTQLAAARTYFWPVGYGAKRPCQRWPRRETETCRYSPWFAGPAYLHSDYLLPGYLIGAIICTVMSTTTGGTMPPPTKFSEDIVPLSDMKVNPGRVVNQVGKTHRPVLLTNRGRGVAVVQSLRDYETQAEELAFVRDVVQGLMDLEEGREMDLADVRKRLGQSGT